MIALMMRAANCPGPTRPRWLPHGAIPRARARGSIRAAEGVPEIRAAEEEALAGIGPPVVGIHNSGAEQKGSSQPVARRL